MDKMKVSNILNSYLILCFARLCVTSLFLSSITSCKTDERVELKESDTMFFPGLEMHQSMAFDDDYALFVTPVRDELVCDLYSISSGTFISRIHLLCGEYSIPHANVTCFGNQYMSEKSIVPLIYVSSWDNHRLAFVYDLSLEAEGFASSLIQVIDPSDVSEDIIGGGYLDWVVDGKGGYLYSLAYHLPGTPQKVEGNYTHITKFRLPSYNDYIIHLHNKDVLDSFSVAVMAFSQDKCYSNGLIYAVAGMPDSTGSYPPKLFVVDTVNKELKEYLIPIVGEPEGVCFYKGKKWLNMYGSSIVYNLDTLIMANDIRPY